MGNSLQFTATDNLIYFDIKEDKSQNKFWEIKTIQYSKMSFVYFIFFY